MQKMTIFILGAVICCGLLSAQSYEFPLKRSKLDQVYASKGMPLLEGNVTYQKELSNGVRSEVDQIPQGLSNVEYTAIPISPDSEILGIRGIDSNNNLVYYIDTDADLKFSNETPVAFSLEENIQVARIPITYKAILNGEYLSKSTELTLQERKPGKLEYHLNELWETELAINDETLEVALQRWSILFIDINFSGSYEKLFFPDREILALGGNFFKVNIDFLAEKITLEKTDRAPVDRGFPAPDFDIPIWQHENTFRLSEHKGSVVVLTFWSPLCPGSRAEAQNYSQLAEKYTNHPSVKFLAVTNDKAALETYLASTTHRFQHSMSSELWECYGVTAPFVTFIITPDGIIAERYFRFSSQLEAEIDSHLQD